MNDSINKMDLRKLKTSLSQKYIPSNLVVPSQPINIEPPNTIDPVLKKKLMQQNLTNSKLTQELFELKKILMHFQY
jgi:hypothetical protein